MPIPPIDFAALPPSDNGGPLRAARDGQDSFDEHLQRAATPSGTNQAPAAPPAPNNARPRKSERDESVSAGTANDAAPASDPAPTASYNGKAVATDSAEERTDTETSEAAPVKEDKDAGKPIHDKTDSGQPGVAVAAQPHEPPAVQVALELPQAASLEVAVAKVGEPAGNKISPAKSNKHIAKTVVPEANVAQTADQSAANGADPKQQLDSTEVIAKAGLQSAGPEAEAQQPATSPALATDIGVTVDKSLAGGTTEVVAANAKALADAAVDTTAQAVDAIDLSTATPPALQADEPAPSGKVSRRAAIKERVAGANESWSGNKSAQRRAVSTAQVVATEPNADDDDVKPVDKGSAAPLATLLASNAARFEPAANSDGKTQSQSAPQSAANSTADLTPTSTTTDASASTPASLRPLELNTRAASSSPTNGSEVDRVRFVQRVAKAFQTAQERGGPLRLRLSPPELGALRLELVVRQGALSAKLEAETPAARALLMENLPQLRERLAQQDIRIERFEVDLLGQTSSGGAQHQSDPGERDRLPRSFNRINARGATAAPTAVVAQAIRPVADGGQLNVII